MSACGPQNSRLHLDDQEAAVKANGTLSGSARRIETSPLPNPNTPKEEPQQPQTPSASEQTIEAKFLDYKDVQIKADFDKDTIQVTFDVTFDFLPNKPTQTITLEGRIQEEGVSRGFADLKPISAKKQDGSPAALPPIAGQARCTNNCDSMVLDLITRDRSGEITSVQFEIDNAIRIRDGKQMEIKIPTIETQDTQSPTEETDKAEVDNETVIEVDFDDAGTDAVPGGYAAPVIDSSLLETVSQNIEDFFTAQLPEIEKKEVEKILSETPARTRGAPVIIYDETKDKENLFPIRLGAEFSGKAFNFYYSYCEIPQANGTTVLASGKVDNKKNPCIKNKKTVIHGAIGEATELLPINIGVQSVQRENAAHYGSGFLVKYLLEAGKIYDQKFPGAKFSVNDTSQQLGGPIWSQINKGRLAHSSHQNGLEADILLAKKGTRYDVEKNWELVKTLVGLGHTHIIYTDRSRIREFCRIAKQKKDSSGKTEFEVYNEALRRLQHWDGHASHLHLRLKCTPHNPSCRQDRVDPIRAKPDC